MSDRGLAVAGLVIAGAYYALARGLLASDLADVVGPAGLPTLYAWALASLSVVLLGRTLLKSRFRSVRLQPDPTRPPKGGHYGDFFTGSLGQDPPYSRMRPAFLTLAVGAAYVVAVPWLGYLVSITLLIVATAYAYGLRVSGRTVAIAASGALALWLLFVWLLGIPQPTGFWPGLLGLHV